MTSYGDFLATKQIVAAPAGVSVEAGDLHPDLFPFQRDLTRWALRKGRAALFATTGMGKTFMQLEWARHAAGRVLILAPLAVARQTVAEGARWGIPVVYARRQVDAAPTGLTITNYEMLDHFDADAFGAVVLDESSVLKDYTSATRNALIAAFARTPMRLCCTATPAPNDIAEIANHAEFLGVMPRAEMLAAFFVHDDEGWRLRKHARQPFYRWLASWGMSLRKPSDLGYPDDGYDLPPLTIASAIVPTTYVPDGMMFAPALAGVGDRARVRRATLTDRVARAAALIAAEPDEPWIAWCGLNDESDALAALFPDALVVEGGQSPEDKATRLAAFAAGEARVLITKPSIAAFGLNLQRCARMVFVGLGDSYEQYFQAIRRCWRYGQTRPVHAHVVLTDLEEPIHGNVLAKEREAERMADELVRHVARFERAEIEALGDQRDPYEPRQPLRLPPWLTEIAA